jgi:uncharacterized sporulation protein YeaH/YhbH (DUF444 family)
MAIFTDIRQTERKRTSSSRDKYLRRLRGVIYDSVDKAIVDQSMDNFGKNPNVKIDRKKLMREVSFVRAGNGEWGIVRTGNEQWVPGDKIPYDSKGSSGNQSGEGTEYDLHLSQKEFMDMIFDGLELPDFEEKQSKKIMEKQYRRSGLSTSGSMVRLHIVKSYLNGYARKRAIETSIREQLESPDLSDDEKDELLYRLEHIPLFEDADLRYRTYSEHLAPISHATAIFVMDVSGSMGDEHKALAKRFFWLVYHFLKSNYHSVDLKFIAHTDEAFEVSEEDFFNSKISGGTKVSTALELASVIAKLAYEAGSNVYVMQASDGDNFYYDNAECETIVTTKLFPYIQGMFYIEIDADMYESLSGILSGDKDSNLMTVYRQIGKKLKTAHVSTGADALSAFRKFFTKAN